MEVVLVFDYCSAFVLGFVECFDGGLEFLGIAWWRECSL